MSKTVILFLFTISLFQLIQKIDNFKMYECYICSDKLQTSNFLVRHLHSCHYSTLQNRYICKQENCISEFQDSHAFKKHLNKKHKSCEKSYANKNDINPFIKEQQDSTFLSIPSEVKTQAKTMQCRREF